jgi:hypothetical protein
VRHIPHYIERSSLPDLLHRVLEGNGLSSGVKVFSLASSLSSSTDGVTKEATVMFEEVPQSLGAEQLEWVFPRESTYLPHNLIIDVHFLGLTVLNDVHPADHQHEYASSTRPVQRGPFL